ncbi:hypothetical protein F4859DRAFT_492513 [Xylaria cf. heliscus]|nr:hypothetical protein F4859DRAFT_492513 [Xylaria cf. heliscus]
MEAFAALGVAVNIAQSIEYGFRLVREVKNLRERGVTDSALNDDVHRLNNLATSITSQNFEKCSGDLRCLAVECAEVSKTLIYELEQLNPTNRESKMQRVKAVWKRERRTSRITELERRLKDHRDQLDLHLTNLSRVEFNDKLDEINQDVQKMKSELTAMNLAMKELSNSGHVGQEISRTIQPLVQQYYDCFLRTTERTILNMLHFPDMHERFDTILDAHTETLHWLLDPADTDCSDKGKAGRDFITWLQQGSGFFHISGKPGAGKSTLMKYICSHPNLDDHLGVWCQGAQLGRGQFFFWKPGTSAQKSIKGLLRGLLHSILYTNRNLIPTALPDLWDLVFNCSSSHRQLEYRDFREGFDNLLKYARLSDQYKFVLFIDGLDEFEGPHLDLITTMKQWTENYPLKICVSSREYGVFLQSFSPYPKLRLHECNSMDIEKMVSARLKSNQFCADFFKSDQEVRMIVSLVEERSDGVFIWVSIVLAGIEDAIISGADLPEVQTRIKAYPGELNDLYWHLVHLIHETDRTWAFRALKMVQFYQCHHIVPTPSSWRMGLLQLSFLDNVQYNDAMIDFPKAPALRPATAPQRLENTYKKIYGRCKGLLNVTHIRNLDIPQTMTQQVVLTHRSIVEFLETPSFVQMARPYLSGFDCFRVAFGTILQCIEYQNPTPDIFVENRISKNTTFTDNSICFFWRNIIDIHMQLAFKLQPVTSNLSLDCLEAFQERFLELSRKVKDRPALSSWAIQYFALVGLGVGITEPWKRIRDEYPNLMRNLFRESFCEQSFITFFSNGFRCRWSNITQAQWIDVLDCFISLGFHFKSKLDFRSGNLCLWGAIISYLVRDQIPETWSPGLMIDWCLKHGAEPDLTIGNVVPGGPHSLQSLGLNGEWQLIWLLSPTFSFGISAFETPSKGILVINETSALCQNVKRNGGVLELRDLLSYWFPDDEYFPNLIDRLQSGKFEENFDSALSPNVVGGPPRYISRRACETDYKVYNQDDILEALRSKGLGTIDVAIFTTG